jgi:hypothetical protein
MFVITGCFQSPLSKTLLPLLSALLLDATKLSALLLDAAKLSAFLLDAVKLSALLLNAAKQRLHVWWKEIRCAAATFLLRRGRRGYRWQAGGGVPGGAPHEHLWVAFLGGNGQLDLQAVENRGEGAQVRHQA